jgi:endonuclease-3
MGVKPSKTGRIIDALRAFYGPDAFRVEVGDPYRALVGCILSQRTRDANSARAAEALFSVADTPEGILGLDENRLRQLIRPSGFYNQKARHITEASRQIVERFHGETPRTRSDLMSLPGVGAKTADIVLSYGYGEPAIAVDTHINRVARRLGLARGEAKPEEVKLALEGDLPPSDWSYADGALLQLGKDTCRPRKPACGRCPVEKLCGYQEKRF